MNDGKARSKATGLGCLLLAACIGAGWQVATRQGVTSNMGPLELAVFRYGVPAVVLSPVWWALLRRPGRIAWPALLTMACTGGLLFGLLVAKGAVHAPAVHIGVFLAVGIPLFTAALSRAITGERVVGLKAVGLCCCLAGAGLMTAKPGSHTSMLGDVFFVGASLAWAIHTLAFKKSGLIPIEGVAVTSFCSVLAMLTLVPLYGAPALSTVPTMDLLVQFVWQGLLAGLVGVWAYFGAIRRLGVLSASFSAAIVPGITAAGAAYILGESLDVATVMSVVFVGCGVLLVSNAGRHAES